MPQDCELNFLGREDFFCSHNGVGVNSDCVFDALGVATGESRHDGNASCLGDFEYQRVALLEAFDGQT